MQLNITFLGKDSRKLLLKNKHYRKVGKPLPFYRGEARSICNLKFNVP